jgi:hypothetical protein
MTYADVSHETWRVEEKTGSDAGLRQGGSDASDRGLGALEPLWT